MGAPVRRLSVGGRCPLGPSRKVSASVAGRNDPGALVPPTWNGWPSPVYGRHDLEFSDPFRGPRATPLDFRPKKPARELPLEVAASASRPGGFFLVGRRTPIQRLGRT